MRYRRLWMLALSCVLGVSLPQATAMESTASSASPSNPPDTSAPLIVGARWHHVHLNATDVAAAIEYYTRHFNATREKFAGVDAVRTQNSWLLFEKVSAKPATAHDTAIWHIGWGAPDPQAEFERQRALGAKFHQPLTDISTALGGQPGRFFYMYLESPDGTWIELNTARTDHFGHLHLFAADPIAAGDWYIRFFGVKGRAPSTPDRPARAPRMSLSGVQVGPSSSLNFDNVSIIIYPVQYSQKVYAQDWGPGQLELAATRGNVNDHIGVAVPDLEQALQILRANGVVVTAGAKQLSGAYRHAFIEGPDRIAIELIEERTVLAPEDRSNERR